MKNDNVKLLLLNFRHRAKSVELREKSFSLRALALRSNLFQFFFACPVASNVSFSGSFFFFSFTFFICNKRQVYLKNLLNWGYRE